MESLKQKMGLAEQRCKQNGSRLTDKRKQVLSLLVRSGKALSAYELIDAYQNASGEPLSAMSMYRFLEFLEQESLVHRLELANKYVACEHISCDQEHACSQFLICSECEKVKEISISDAAMAALQRNVEQFGFSLTSQQLEMKGVCEKCRTAATAKNTDATY